MATILRFALRPLRPYPALRPLGTRYTSAAAIQTYDVYANPDHDHAPAVEPLRPVIQPESVLPRVEELRNAKPFSQFLTDRYHRQHTYLRISVTERCNLRCTYCMPPEGVALSPPDHLLTTPEIVHLSELFVKEGVNKIRLTGGEPTVRKDIVPLMHKIGNLRAKGLKELCLTTNGISLHRKLDAMVEAGLTGVNLSLDTLDPYQFQIMTRRKGFDAVMKSLEMILEMNRLGAGIKLKINAVIMRGVNEREIVSFVEMGREHDMEVRFIEYMPFDGNKWSQQKMLSYKEMVEIIRHKYPRLSKVQEEGKNETSKAWQVPGFKGKVGFITSMTENFCGTCNRLRITADGNLKVCLFGNSEVNLRDLLREENHGEPINWAALEAMKQLQKYENRNRYTHTNPAQQSAEEGRLLEVIGLAVKRKKERHAGMGQLENMKNRPMILIEETPQLSQIESKVSSKDMPGFGPIYLPTGLRQRLSAHQKPFMSSGYIMSPQQAYVPAALGASLHTNTRLSHQRDKTCTTPQSLQKSLGSKLDKKLKEVPKYGPPYPLTMHRKPKESVPDVRSTHQPGHDRLPHLTPGSEVHQISVGHKAPTQRVAVAIGLVRFTNPELLNMIKNHGLKKGDVLAVARVAGIMAVKSTSNLIPLAHNNVAVEGCSVNLSLIGSTEERTIRTPQEYGELLGRMQPIGECGGLRIKVACESTGKTGVEMEAMCGVVGAALTVVDMCKAMDKGISIGDVKVIGKKGGKSGDWGIFAKNFSYPTGQPPTPTRTPISASFTQGFETPKQESSFYDPRVTWNTADPWAESPDFLKTPKFPSFSTPLKSPSKSSVNKRPLSSQNIEEQIASHVHHLSPNPEQALPPVEISRRLSSSPNPLSTTKRPLHRTSETQLTPLKTSLDEEATSSMRSAGSMQTPPPTSTSASRRKAQQAQIAKVTKQSTSTGRRMSTSAVAKGKKPEAAITQVETSPGFPSLQFSPEVFSFPNSGPATAPAFPQHKLFWDPEPAQDAMNIDLTADDPFALGIGMDKPLDPFATSQEQTTPSRLPSTSFHALEDSNDDLAVFPVSAKVPAKKFSKSRITSSVVNPSMLFSSPGQPSELSNISTSQSEMDVNLQPYAHQVLDAERETESGGPRKSKKRKGPEKDSPAVKAAMEVLRDEADDHPVIRRSFTDSVLPPFDPSHIQAALSNRPIKKRERMSPGRGAPRRRLSPYRSAQQAQKQTTLTLTVDSTGRARTEKKVVKNNAIPSSDSRMDLDSATDDDESSTSSEEDDIAMSQRQSFGFALQKPKKAKLTRFALESRTHSQKSSYASTFASNSTASGVKSVNTQRRVMSNMSAKFDDPSLLPPMSDDRASSSTLVSDRLDGRDAHNSDGDTTIESDDGKGDAQSELKKMKLRREQSKATQTGNCKPTRSRGFEYPNPASANAMLTFPYTLNPSNSHTMNDPFNISPTTITDPDLATPNSARDSQVSGDSTRCVCHGTESDGDLMILCESCKKWLHVRCVGLNRNKLPKVYLCVFCTGSTPNVRGGRVREPQRALFPATTSRLAHKSQRYRSSGDEEEEQIPNLSNLTWDSLIVRQLLKLDTDHDYIKKDLANEKTLNRAFDLLLPALHGL
ncbi:MAG: hypothetical protein Q9213_006679 [Squamulea squamosa]